MQKKKMVKRIMIFSKAIIIVQNSSQSVKKSNIVVFNVHKYKKEKGQNYEYFYVGNAVNVLRFCSILYSAPPILGKYRVHEEGAYIHNLWGFSRERI